MDIMSDYKQILIYTYDIILIVAETQL
jgi:hypothetical protein